MLLKDINGMKKAVFHHSIPRKRGGAKKAKKKFSFKNVFKF